MAVLISATPALGQSADFDGYVAGVLDGFRDAAANEMIVPYLMSLRHVDVNKAEADWVGSDVDTYVASAINGYTSTRDLTEISAFEVFDDNAAFGRGAHGEWAVVSYAIAISFGTAPPLSQTCNRLIVFERDGSRYASMIPDGVAGDLFRATFPDYVAPLDAHPADCGF